MAELKHGTTIGGYEAYHAGNIPASGTIFAIDVSVTANTIIANPGYPVASYTIGLSLNILIANVNSGNVTLNVSSLGAKYVKRPSLSGLLELPVGCLIVGNIIQVVYDGTGFQVVFGLPAIWE